VEDAPQVKMQDTSHVLVHEEVTLAEMELDADLDGYVYPCPCGDEFFLSIDDMLTGYNIAECPSCSLKVRVDFDLQEMLKKYANRLRDE
jgi:diphthamide biosynthesis protein 3